MKRNKKSRTYLCICIILLTFAPSQKTSIVNDEKELNSDNEYEAFQKLYKDELMKVDMKVSDEKLEENQKKRKVAKRTKARAVLTNILVPGAGVVEVASAIATGKQNIKLTREMMFLYAITKFYLEEMEDFINK